jgi:hypothetical protein
MDEKVSGYIEKQKSPQKEILSRLRQIIAHNFPGIREEMKWGVPNFEGRYYIVALKDHVNLGFSLKGLSIEEQKIFEGSGKTMKHMKFYSLSDIDEKRIISLLNIVKAKGG